MSRVDPRKRSELPPRVNRGPEKGLSVAALRRLLTYDPITGIIRRTGIGHRQIAGEQFATQTAKGALVGSIYNRQHRAARVAWALWHGTWPRYRIQHLNGDRCDLRLINLADMPGKRSNPEARFVSYLGPESPNGCIEWAGGHSTSGYGQFRVEPGITGTVPAHRYAYERVHGLIPKGMLVCHSCDNPPCVNPEHLWLGTPNDNMQDMIRKGRDIKTKRSDRDCGRNLENGDCGHTATSLLVKQA